MHENHQKFVPPVPTPATKASNPSLPKAASISAPVVLSCTSGFIPDTLDTKAYDGIVRVTSDDALALGREIGGKEGFLVGISSAAAIYGAIEVAKKLGTGKKSSCSSTR